MKYEVGQKLYSCMVDMDGNTELLEWHVRTIRGGVVYAVQKVDGETWVKQSKKHFDYSWAKNIDPLYRMSANVGCRFARLSTTKRGAWVLLLKFLSGKYGGYLTDDLDKAKRNVRKRIKRKL